MRKPVNLLAPISAETHRKIIALYIRLSLEDYKSESLSIQNQRLILRRHAETLAEYDNAEIIEFVDNGYSGTNFERPGVQELLELVRCGKIDCIIVKDFSRFGRNSIETGYFIEQVFPLFRTRFISVSDNFDTVNYKEDTGGMEVAFKYLISEYYSRDLSKKSKSAKYMKMKRGEYQSKICPYGYKKGTDGRLAIDEESAQVVRMIFSLSLDGNNAHQIVQALYDKKISTPGEYKTMKGSKAHDVSRSHSIWQRSAVLRILDDERYTGTYIMGKREVKELGGNRSRLKDKSEWFIIPNHHPAIIDNTVFEQIQARLLHFNSEKKIRNEYALRGKVVCGCCNHGMARKNTKEPAFLCRYTRVDTSFECHGLQIGESELEGLLFDVITKQAQVILNVDDIVNIKELDERLTQKTSYEKQIHECQDGKRRLYEQFLLQEIDMERYKAEKSAYDNRLDSLKQVYDVLLKQTAQMTLDSKVKTEMREIADTIIKSPTLTPVLADLLIDKVYVHPENQVRIDWKIEDFCK